MTSQTKESKSGKYELRNVNKELVQSLEIGQNRLVVSLENLKTNYGKSRRDVELENAIKQLEKKPPRPKRKNYVNTYHVNEGDPMWNGFVINNVNDISVKPAVIRDRECRILTRSSGRNARTITRKIKKCQEPNLAKTVQEAPTRLDLDSKDTDSYEESLDDVNVTKPSERGTFKEIIQKSKKQKLIKDENVLEENLRDTYFKKLRDSGNIRLKSERLRSKNSESQVKPESDFWNTRGQPLLGYDFIAGTLDNSKISVLSLPDQYFDKLQKFRNENKNECFSNEKLTNKDESFENEKKSKIESANSRNCASVRDIHDITLNSKTRNPYRDSSKRSGPLTYPKLRQKMNFGNYDPKSMALVRNCSVNKMKGKVGCTLGHY